MIESRRQRILAVLFPALLPPLQLLLFGSHTLYMGNEQEFSVPFWTLAAQTAPVIAVLAGALVVVGIVLPKRIFPFYVVALVSLGIALWIQGNLIVGDYGVLNGEELDWSGHAWRNRHEMALWIVLPVLATIAARRVLSTAVFATRILIALQVVVLTVSAARADREAQAKWQGPPDAIFELSSKQNVFHLVLDGFQSDIFKDILEAEREEIENQFSGFTFFSSHIGAFPTTIVSIPAMLTGAAYRNQEPMRRHIARQFERASLFGVMRAQGYQVDAVSGLDFDEPSATNYYRLPAPYVTYEAHTRFAAWQLADLALFRHAPHLAKPAIYNGQSWRLQTTLGKSANTTAMRHMPVNGQAFLRDFTARMHVTRERPHYKYLHVGVPHWPMALSADCEYIGVKGITRPIYAGQARCGIRRVGELLDRLRDLGLYDSSLILISSDHGIALPVAGFTGDRDVFGGKLSVLAGSAHALLMIKPPNGAGRLRVSAAPTTITDIPATIVDTLGLKNRFPGVPALRLDETSARARSFADYPRNSADWHADYFPYMDLFTIEGSAVDGNAWKTEEPIYAPGIDTGRRSRGLYRPERGSPGMVFQWSSPLAFLHAPPDARGLELMVRSVTPAPQTVTVEMRGEIVDRVTLRDHEWHTLRYPIGPRAADAKPGPEWVVLRVDPPWRVRGDRRTFGVMTRNLKWIS